MQKVKMRTVKTQSGHMKCTCDLSMDTFYSALVMTDEGVTQDLSTGD